MDDEVTLADGYVLVLNESIPTLERAQEVLAAIDATLIRGGVDRVLFDTRETAPPPDELRPVMWEWVHARKHHQRCAIVASSEMRRISGNMTARSMQAPLRSFADFDEALRWLLSD